jgi:penicillin-binding protein 1A
MGTRIGYSQRAGKDMRFTVKITLIVTIVALLLSPFVYFMVIYCQSYDILKKGREYRPYLSTRIYDINGELISELFEENRNFIPIDEVPLKVKQAFMAAEDQNFYQHTGVDLLSVIRAIIVDIFSGEIVQGGSTITQQLVKQLYTRGEKSFRRKIIELLIAREFEKRYSKDKIFEMYLNHIYFGHGAYGIQSAAKFYFDKEVADLNVIEASILVSIPSAPNRYSPLKNHHLALERTKQVIFNMISSGYLTKQEALDTFTPYWSAFLKEIRTRYPTLSVRNKKFDRAPYFTEYIRRILIQRYGEEVVYRGGLSVYTTLDLRQQDIARKVLREGLERQNRIAAVHNRSKIKVVDRILIENSLLHQKHPSKKFTSHLRLLSSFRNDSIADVTSLLSLLFDVPQMGEKLEYHLNEYKRLRLASRVEGALIAIDLRSGGISAMIGGSDFNQDNQLNRALQSFRQPGSAFKAFVYGAGIESRLITPATLFLDGPLAFGGTRTVWSPSNYGKSFYGNVLVRRALVSSLNTISVLVYERVGGNRIADFASRLMNIPRSRFEIDPTLALGTTEVSLFEMARGFAVFANRGREVTPYAIRSIHNRDGKKIYDGERIMRRRKKRQIISPESSFIMTNLLRGVVDYGTASIAIRRQSGFRLPAAGKTGTNSDFRDAWFIGFTPDLVAAVWIGCDSQRFSLGPGQAGAVAAAPVWARFMNGVYRFRGVSRFGGPPPGVERCKICGITGRIPVKGCPIRYEYFISQTEPREKCRSDHSEVVSIFKLAKKRRAALLEKELSKREQRENEDL